MNFISGYQLACSDGIFYNRLQFSTLAGMLFLSSERDERIYLSSARSTLHDEQRGGSEGWNTTLASTMLTILSLAEEKVCLIKAKSD